MKTRIFGLIVAVLIGIIPIVADAASAQSTAANRYFIPTTKTLWKNAFRARNVFSDGFTADLSDFQLKLAKIAGLRPIVVKRFSILAETESTTPTPSIEPAQQRGWGVKLLGSEDLLASASEDITVAILDTGADINHPDIADRVIGCFNFTDPAKHFVEKSCDDGNGHGTHIAGIIAADGGSNGDGVIGMDPKASLIISSVCNDEGTCYSDDIAVAMNRAVDEGANILALGFGGEAESSFIDDALAYAKEKQVLVVAGSGNDGPYKDSIDWPARDPRVISVGALDEDGEVADFSSRGASISFIGPGVQIESTYPNKSYSVLSGTSMAAPHIAGLAALLWDTGVKHPSDEVLKALQKISAILP